MTAELNVVDIIGPLPRRGYWNARRKALIANAIINNMLSRERAAAQIPYCSPEELTEWMRRFQAGGERRLRHENTQVGHRRRQRALAIVMAIPAALLAVGVAYADKRQDAVKACAAYVATLPETEALADAVLGGKISGVLEGDYPKTKSGFIPWGATEFCDGMMDGAADAMADVGADLKQKREIK